MKSDYGRAAAAFRNEYSRSASALVGIAQGLLADGVLQDDEIQFLNNWLSNNTALSSCWPGNIIYSRVKEALADGHISESEREHLQTTLQQLIGGNHEQLANAANVCALAMDTSPPHAHPQGKTFVFTGDFFFGSRSQCEEATTKRGGAASKSVSKKIDFVVVGSLGSPEWKHGSYGTKIDKAMQLKSAGCPIYIIHEDHWAKALFE